MKHVILLAIFLSLFASLLFFATISFGSYSNSTGRNLSSSNEDTVLEAKHGASISSKAEHCNEYLGLKTCPEAPVTHRPVYPKLGQYSLAACAAIHKQNSPNVTLRDGERLADAYNRLRALGASGVIEVPWNIDTVQCDKLAPKKKIESITIRGISGPKGEQPRFYCRSHRKDGTVTKGYGSVFFTAINGGESFIENIEVDGYGSAIFLPRYGTFKIRNSYIHHQTGNAFNMSGIPDDTKKPDKYTGGNFEICGVELSHAGQGNVKHGMYVKRSNLENPKSAIRLTVVDSIIHSMSGSSGIKSIARKNVIVGNKFYNFIRQPGYSVRSSAMQLDISSCTETEVRDNYFNGTRNSPDLGYSADGPIIGIRLRRGIHGCNLPDGYVHDDAGKHLPRIGSEFWNPAYWEALNKTPIAKLSWQVKNNIFEIEPNTYKASRQVVMKDRGTYPAFQKKRFGASCLLPVPEKWFERHRVYVSNNTYSGFDYENNKYGKIYVSDPIVSELTPAQYPKRCGGPIPQPDLRFEIDSYFVIGPGEIYQ